MKMSLSSIILQLYGSPLRGILPIDHTPILSARHSYTLPLADLQFLVPLYSTSGADPFITSMSLFYYIIQTILSNILTLRAAQSGSIKRWSKLKMQFDLPVTIHYLLESSSHG